MKNFEVRYPTDGTSALQPKLAHTPVGGGAIIEFPGNASQSARAGRSVAGHRSILCSDMARSLRSGSARGCAYDRIAPWQAALAGVVFATAALLVLLLGS